ncbi:hypothetical protein [Methanosarcina sp.]
MAGTKIEVAVVGKRNKRQETKRGQEKSKERECKIDEKRRQRIK